MVISDLDHHERELLGKLFGLTLHHQREASRDAREAHLEFLQLSRELQEKESLKDLYQICRDFKIVGRATLGRGVATVELKKKILVDAILKAN